MSATNTDHLSIDRFTYNAGMTILDAAAVAGWIVRSVHRSPARSYYIRLQHRLTRCKVTVRISDHPPTNRSGNVRSIECGRGDECERLAVLFQYLSRHPNRWRKRQRKRIAREECEGMAA